MRPSGNFVYFLKDVRDNIIARIKSPTPIMEGDELNFKGNKILVVDRGADTLTVARIGCALVVEEYGE